MKFYLSLVCVWCVYHEVGCVWTDVVVVEQGHLRGVRSGTRNVYYSVPYAVSRRFQPPEDPPRWNGTLLAVRRFTTCAQAISTITLGTEDCLHLDIHTPRTRGTDHPLPVMLYFHGGGYYYGSKAHYDPEYLVNKRTIGVIVNYRVGVLGFLCLKDIANLGLKDQVAALRWIRRNIAAFGGDPDNVTLIGQSAGASAAGMHLLSPSSKGLFHKVIMMSGVPLSPWAFNIDPVTPAFEDARKLGPARTAGDVIEIFTKAPLRELLLATQDTSINTKYFKYSPCVEAEANEPFFPDAPARLLRSGNFNKVPVMVGHTSAEGILFYGLHNEGTLKELDDNFKEKLPSIFTQCSQHQKENISNIFRSHYFGNGPINSSKFKGVVNYYSDWLAYSSIDAFSALMGQVSERPVYNYMFAYEGRRNFAKFIFGSGLGIKGASHSDDIFYIFKPAGLSLRLSNQDKLFIDRLTTMIANFMRTGNPTPSQTELLPVLWPRRGSPAQLLRLDSTFSVQGVDEDHQARLWQELLCEHGEPGYTACAQEN